jgi:hypothetical protein
MRTKEGGGFNFKREKHDKRNMKEMGGREGGKRRKNTMKNKTGKKHEEEVHEMKK